MKKDAIAICVSCLAMIGTLGNFAFNLYTYEQSKKTSMEILLRPILNEEGTFASFPDDGGILQTFCYCEITNTSNNEIIISNVHGETTGSLGNWSGSWWIPNGYSFEDMQKYIYMYDEKKLNLTKTHLPLKIERKGKLNFIIPVDIPIGNDLLMNLNFECRQLLNYKLTPRMFINECLDMSLFDFDHKAIFSNDIVSYKLTQVITVITTENESFSKNHYLYFMPKSPNFHKQGILEKIPSSSSGGHP